MRDGQNQPLPGEYGYRPKEGGRKLTLKRRHWEVGAHKGLGIAFVFGDDEDNVRRITALLNLFANVPTDALEARQEDVQKLVEFCRDPDLVWLIRNTAEGDVSGDSPNDLRRILSVCQKRRAALAPFSEPTRYETTLADALSMGGQT